MRVTIIGAGIVGITTAHALLDEGHEVTLVDPGDKSGRATDANAGWIAHCDIMPLASPKIWSHVPRWLLDPLGPLAIRPGYLPRLAPWLVRFLRASSPQRIEASIEAIRSINAEALPAWLRRLEICGLRHHLRERGTLSVWRSQEAFAKAKNVLRRQREFDIPFEMIGSGDLKTLEPSLYNAPVGVIYPGMCHVSDPATLATELMAAALARGARHVRAEARAIRPANDAVHVVTDVSDVGILSDRVVLAAGAWSKLIAKSLGDAIPLDTERGYNATFPTGTFGLSRPVMFEGEGFVTTPLDIGDRIGGAVEFAGLDAPANHRRADAMIARLKHFLPHLDSRIPARRWMGFRPSIPDSLPVIGSARGDERVVYAFGHGHYGLTQAAVTAEIVAAKISNRRGPVDATPFSPRRF
ncbi:NAD(P)/FAD-dependent oxidoreductase [Microvirga terricola]|uniref:FAD-dependent oxidoreductase n=1 Tax=Microvirga terricola TaxID=2719797 RepID=A0ABX0VGY2_9HYPH|nr:FAD-dependent oxidoreductase [Microvirga terricola]NIX78395.1 FAD-dependent oxidoreductase [Microvirga terricola]